LTSPPDWTTRAACLGQASRAFDPWHPDGDLPARHRRLAEQQAKLVCLGCPVQTDCIRLGLELVAVDTVEGIFGGLRPAELRALARKLARTSRKVAQHGTRSGYVAHRKAGQEPCDLCRAANAADKHARDEQRRLGVPALTA